METPSAAGKSMGYLFSVTVLALLATAPAIVSGQETHGHGAAIAHTHIGVNPTWRPADWSRPGEGAVDTDPTDNDKLWLFSMPPMHPAATPGWPHWQHADGGAFLVLTPVLEEGQRTAKPGDPNKALYTCDFLYSRDEGYGDPHGAEHLDGWNSAFDPQGAWNLAAGNADTTPAWDIYLRRERISSNLDPDDFLMLLPDDTAALMADGDTHTLPKRWLSDEGAWGIHAHAGFYFWLDEADEDVSVTFSAHDAGGLYQRSAEFAMRFAKRVRRPIPGDINGDGVVDIEDLRILLEHWGECGLYGGEHAESHGHDEHEDRP